MENNRECYYHWRRTIPSSACPSTPRIFGYDPRGLTDTEKAEANAASGRLCLAMKNYWRRTRIFPSRR